MHRAAFHPQKQPNTLLKRINTAQVSGAVKENAMRQGHYFKLASTRHVALGNDAAVSGATVLFDRSIGIGLSMSTMPNDVAAAFILSIGWRPWSARECRSRRRNVVKSRPPNIESNANPGLGERANARTRHIVKPSAQ